MKLTLKTAFTTTALILSLTTGAQVFEASKTGSSLIVKGTSNLHAWEMNLTDYSSTLQLTSDQMKVNKINNITFTCKVKDLRSESSIMDKKAWEALNSKNYPEITFSGTAINGLISGNGVLSGTVTGKLTLAGQTREVSFPFKGSFTDNRSIIIEASTELAMSTFKVSPPTALMGTLKTGDKVTIALKLNYFQK